MIRSRLLKGFHKLHILQLPDIRSCWSNFIFAREDEGYCCERCDEHVQDEVVVHDEIFGHGEIAIHDEIFGHDNIINDVIKNF